MEESVQLQALSLFPITKLRAIFEIVGLLNNELQDTNECGYGITEWYIAL
jgi:hypothetical protein